MDKISKYQELANKFADLIEKNEAPWQKSWESGGFLPYNIKTGKEYNGMNLLNLMCVAADKGYEDTRWLTFLQASEQNAKVRAGEKGVPIMYLQTTETKKEIDTITGEEIVWTEKLEKPRAIWSVVFNAEQCEGLPALENRGIEFNPIERAEEILNNSGAKIRHRAQDRAYYSPATDTITLPLKEQFVSNEEYYRTALHELGHWTGHSSRNDRDLSGTFGTESYAKEELVAEITSFFVGTQCGLGHEPDKNNIAYLKSWSKAIRDDPSFLFNAVKDADKAAKLILGKELDLEKLNNHELKMSDNINDIIKQADLEYAGRTYVKITNDYKFYMYEEELLEQGKTWKDFNILYDEAHQSYYIKTGNLEDWKESINIDENIKQIFIPNEISLDRYYLDIDEYIMNSMVGKPNPEKIAEHYGFKYDKETERFYCKAEEREKFLPWCYDFNIKSNEDKLYLNITEKEAEKLIAYNIAFDGKNYYIHKDLQNIYANIAKEVGINNMFEKDKTNEKNIEQNTGFKKENSTEKGFFKDLAVNFAWSEDDFGIKDDTILKGEDAYKFLDKLVKKDTEQNKIKERKLNGEDIDGLYYYKTKFAINYKSHHSETVHVDIGDLEFGGKEKVSEAIEYRATIGSAVLIPKEELGNFKKEEDRYLAYLQQKNSNEQTMQKEVSENKIDKDINDRINSVTYINVPKAEKDEAKSLGAKWDRNNMCWFVPADVDTALFNKWEKVNEKDLALRKEQMLQANNTNNKVVNQQENKYILAVPYEEKDQAKALGAEWDKDGKFWFCQESEKDKFFQWDIKNVENKVKSDIPLNIEEEFLNRIKAGGVIENTVIADGEKHRIAVDGDKGKEQSGFYVLHADGVANGYFINNRTGEEIKWSSKEHSYNSMTPEEKAEMKALYNAKKAEREQADTILTEKAEKALYAKFMNKEAINEHTYLSNKMVEPTQNIYAGNDNTITVPLYNVDGRLKSAQYISEDGEKRFAKNTNKVGAFHVVDGNAADLKSATSIIVAEGYATAASINEAVKEPGLKVIAAMSASNIEHAVKAITEKYPAINIVIAADNDLNNKIGNIGLNAANAVADKYKNVTVTVPKINGEEVAGDFNDIISKKGLSKEEALKNIKQSLQPALKLDKLQKSEEVKSKSVSEEKVNYINKESKERILSR